MYMKRFKSLGAIALILESFVRGINYGINNFSRNNVISFEIESSSITTENFIDAILMRNWISKQFFHIH